MYLTPHEAEHLTRALLDTIKVTQDCTRNPDGPRAQGCMRAECACYDLASACVETVAGFNAPPEEVASSIDWTAP